MEENETDQIEVRMDDTPEVRESRIFSTEIPMTDDQWMLIESRMENAWAEALSDYAGEGEDDDEPDVAKFDSATGKRAS